MVCFELHDVVDAWWRLLFEVGVVDERLPRLFAKPFDDIEGVSLVLLVESVQGFVEDKQVRVLYHGAGEERQALFSTG